MRRTSVDARATNRGVAPERRLLPPRLRTLAAAAAIALVGVFGAACAGSSPAQGDAVPFGDVPDASGARPPSTSRGEPEAPPVPSGGVADDGAPDASASPEGPDASTSVDPSRRDVTFFVTSDTHIGRPKEDIDATLASSAMIDGMRATMAATYPAGLGLAAVGAPRGVVITGDLTDDNRAEQWVEFDQIWGANGQGKAPFPVFEGWGNHDLHGGREVIRAGIVARHARRTPRVNAAEEGSHYSWDWQDVHLVHLNLYPGMEGGLSLDSPDTYKPRKSLAFLKADLAARVGATQRPVLLFFHFGFDAGSTRGWSSSEQAAFFEAIASYNVVGIFVGHTHATAFETYPKTVAAGARAFPVYTTGAALKRPAQPAGFHVVHLGPTEMVVVERVLRDPRKDWGVPRRTPIRAR